VRVDDRGDLGGQPRGVRACAVTGTLVDDVIVLDERDASGTRRCIQRNYTHVAKLSADS
jgi:hypothetical protein